MKRCPPNLTPNHQREDCATCQVISLGWLPKHAQQTEKRVALTHSSRLLRCSEAPMSALCAQALVEVFLRVPPGQRRLLPLVCKLWRRVALQSPELWARVQVGASISSSLRHSAEASALAVPLCRASFKTAWWAAHRRSTLRPQHFRRSHFRPTFCCGWTWGPSIGEARARLACWHPRRRGQPACWRRPVTPAARRVPSRGHAANWCAAGGSWRGLMPCRSWNLR